MTIWVWDLRLLILTIVGGDIVLFLLTYLALHSREGIFYEIYSRRKHHYRFALWMAVGQSTGFVLVYLIQRYFTPSPLETIGIVLFALILLISFTTVVYGVRIWNLERWVGKGNIVKSIDRYEEGFGNG